MLPPMLIFKGKTDKAIKKLCIPERFIVKTQEKSWMDEGWMEVWVEEIWLKYVREVSQQPGFDNSLLTFDAFSAHKTDDIQSKLVEIKSDLFFNDPSWMHVEMSTDGRLHQQAVQGKITQMLGYLHFKNNRTNASDTTR